jgi:hypothetical protein
MQTFPKIGQSKAQLDTLLLRSPLGALSFSDATDNSTKKGFGLGFREPNR